MRWLNSVHAQLEDSVTAACGSPHPDSRQAIRRPWGEGCWGRSEGTCTESRRCPSRSAVGILGLARSAACAKRVVVKGDLSELNCPFYCHCFVLFKLFNGNDAAPVGAQSVIVSVIKTCFWQLFLPPRLPPHIISGKPTPPIEYASPRPW